MWLHETVGEVIKCMEADVGQSQHIMLSWLNTLTCLNECRSTTLSFTAHRLEQSQCLGLQTSTGGAQVEHLCSTCAPPVLTGSVWRCFHGSVAAPVLKELQECGGIYWHWFAFSNTAVSASLCPTYEAVCCFFHSQDETSDSPSSRLVS